VHIVQFGYPQLIFRFRLCDSVCIKYTSVKKKENIPTYSYNVRNAAWKLTVLLLPLVGVNGRIPAGRIADILIVWSECHVNRHEHR